MTDIASLLWAVAGGATLGLFYFYGLWFTVQRLHGARAAPLWVLISGATRMSVLLAGLYYLGHGDWRRLLCALGGIVLARLLMTRRIGSLRTAPAASMPGGNPS